MSLIQKKNYSQLLFPHKILLYFRAIRTPHMKQNLSSPNPKLQSIKFTLKKIDPSQNGHSIIHFFLPQTLCFSYHPQQNQSEQILKLPSHPVYNNDNIFFTPTFMPLADKIRTPYDLPCFEKIHKERIERLSFQSKQIFIPFPNNNDRFCSICKEQYQDYSQHSTTLAHLKKMRNNQFSKDIVRLTKIYKRQLVKFGKKTKYTKKKEHKKEIQPIKQDENTLTNNSTVPISSPSYA